MLTPLVENSENSENGGMAQSDLRKLIENRVPEHRAILESSHGNLEDVAAYCEDNYLKARDRNKAFEETKQFAVQSLASVAYQINTLARDLLDMLELQTDKIDGMTTQVDSLSMVVNIHKEKLARREIGALTTNKTCSKQPKFISPSVQEPVVRYKRTPIDYSVLDGVGHGARPVETPIGRTNMVSRTGSSISGAQSPYGASYSQIERTANINNTLSRTSMRSGMSCALGSEHYKVPQVLPLLDESRFSAHSSGSVDHFRGAFTSTPNSQKYGNEYGSNIGLERYGTLRAPRGGVASNIGMPLPPPQLCGQYDYGTLGRGQLHELPPPPAALLNSMHEDILPPPPNMQMQQSFFDTTQADWVPTTYIEKAIAIYDYDADKNDELSLRENCVVYVVRKNDDGWFEGVLDGVTGLFPGNYVQPVD